MAHPLVAYLEKRGEKLYAFARRTGLPGTSLARAIAGKRGLSLELAFRVEHLTGGRVPAECWTQKRRRATRAA